MKTITISVTQEDIDVGYQMDTGACPVSRAISRSIGMHAVLISGGYWIPERSLKGKGGGPFCLPEDALEFARRFYSGLKTRPFKFKLGFKRWKYPRLGIARSPNPSST